MLLFLKVFFTEFIAEMGDKTQLMLIALTSKYKLKDIIMGNGGSDPGAEWSCGTGGRTGQRIYPGMAD